MPPPRFMCIGHLGYGTRPSAALDWPPMRAKTGWFVAAVTVALSTLATVPARADVTPPRLDSFSRVSPRILGGENELLLRFAARDGGGAGVLEVTFEYEGPYGYAGSAQAGALTGSTVSGVAIWKLRRWAASGTYRLVAISVHDHNGNATTYRRDGSVEVGPEGASKPPNTFVFAGGDFRVDNPEEDILAPALVAVRLFQDPVPAGEPVVVEYTAKDDRSGVVGVWIQYTTPSGGTVYAEVPRAFAAAGPASWTVPLAAGGGLYTVAGIVVADAQDNLTLYSPEGDASTIPAGITRVHEAIPDARSIEFTVTPKQADLEAPVISSLSRLSSGTIHPGELAALDYRAADTGGTGIEEITATWFNGYGQEITARKRCGLLERGPLTTLMKRYATIGMWRLGTLSVNDRLGNTSRYERSGRLVTVRSGSSVETTHPLALASGDFRLSRGDASEPRWEDTTYYDCATTPAVSIDASDDEVAVGSTVTVAGRVTRAGSAVPRPLMVIYSYTSSRPKLVSIQRGTSTGRYVRSFVIDRNRGFRTRFLGADQANPASPRASGSVSVGARTRVGAALDRSTIRLGEAAVMSGYVSPEHARQRVYLQRYSAGAWRTVASRTLWSSSRFAFTVRPSARGSFMYRVYKGADADHVASWSGRRALEVR